MSNILEELDRLKAKSLKLEKNYRELLERAQVLEGKTLRMGNALNVTVSALEKIMKQYPTEESPHIARDALEKSFKIVTG